MNWEELETFLGNIIEYKKDLSGAGAVAQRSFALHVTNPELISVQSPASHRIDPQSLPGSITEHKVSSKPGAPLGGPKT